MPPHRVARLLACACALGVATGCAVKPLPKDACTRPDLSGCIIEDVEVLENDVVADGDIEGKIATAETSRVLEGTMEHVPILSAWDRLTVEYELFDRFVLERDLARVERYYRARGFYEAHARAGRVIKLEDRKVRVEIVVDEGPPVDKIVVEATYVDTPEQSRLESYPHAKKLVAAKAAVQNAINGLRGQPRFEEAAYEQLKADIVKALTHRGFA